MRWGGTCSLTGGWVCKFAEQHDGDSWADKDDDGGGGGGEQKKSKSRMRLDKVRTRGRRPAGDQQEEEMVEKL
eukprot:767193-Hanusia_phi.AAC.10